MPPYEDIQEISMQPSSHTKPDQYLTPSPHRSTGTPSLQDQRSQPRIMASTYGCESLYLRPAAQFPAPFVAPVVYPGCDGLPVYPRQVQQRASYSPASLATPNINARSEGVPSPIATIYPHRSADLPNQYPAAIHSPHPVARNISRSKNTYNNQSFTISHSPQVAAPVSQDSNPSQQQFVFQPATSTAISQYPRTNLHQSIPRNSPSASAPIYQSTYNHQSPIMAQTSVAALAHIPRDAHAYQQQAISQFSPPYTTPMSAQEAYKQLLQDTSPYQYSYASSLSRDEALQQMIQVQMQPSSSSAAAHPPNNFHGSDQNTIGPYPPHTDAAANLQGNFQNAYQGRTFHNGNFLNMTTTSPEALAHADHRCTASQPTPLRAASIVPGASPNTYQQRSASFSSSSRRSPVAPHASPNANRSRPASRSSAPASSLRLQSAIHQPDTPPQSTSSSSTGPAAASQPTMGSRKIQGSQHGQQYTTPHLPHGHPPPAYSNYQHQSAELHGWPTMGTPNAQYNVVPQTSQSRPRPESTAHGFMPDEHPPGFFHPTGVSPYTNSGPSGHQASTSYESQPVSGQKLKPYRPRGRPRKPQSSQPSPHIAVFQPDTGTHGVFGNQPYTGTQGVFRQQQPMSQATAQEDPFQGLGAMFDFLAREAKQDYVDGKIDSIPNYTDPRRWRRSLSPEPHPVFGKNYLGLKSPPPRHVYLDPNRPIFHHYTPSPYTSRPNEADRYLSPPRTLHRGEKKRREPDDQTEGDTERTKRMKIGYEQKAGDNSIPFDAVPAPIVTGLACSTALPHSNTNSPATLVQSTPSVQLSQSPEQRLQQKIEALEAQPGALDRLFALPDQSMPPGLRDTLEEMIERIQGQSEGEGQGPGRMFPVMRENENEV
jgi:hypothetical protein